MLKTARMLPEIVFAPFAFPEEKERHERSLDRLCGSQDGEPPGNDLLERGHRVCSAPSPSFLEERASTTVLARRPKIVGFHAGCLHVCAAVAASRTIKRLLPGVVTVIGGYHALEPMASALLEIAPSIDYAFSGGGGLRVPRGSARTPWKGFFPGSACSGANRSKISIPCPFPTSPISMPWRPGNRTSGWSLKRPADAGGPPKGAASSAEGSAPAGSTGTRAHPA